MPPANIIKIISLVLTLALLFGTRSALADTPPFTPDQFMVCSSNTKYCVVVHRICPDNRKGCAFIDEVTRVYAYKVTNNESFYIWGIYEEVWPGSFSRNGHYLSDDGHYLVESRWFNQIQTNYDNSMPMLKVYRDGEFQFSIELKDLIKDFRNLEKSISTFFWGGFREFDKDGNLIVETVEKRRLAIDIKSGEIAEKW